MAWRAAMVGLLLGVVAGCGGDEKQSVPAKPPPAQEESAEAEEPADTPTTAGFEGEVPILMYHAISPAAPGEPYPELFVPQADFEAQMSWLDDEGYNAVTLDEVFAAWEEGAPIATNPVVISFDDGLRSQYVGATPIMEELGWPGVLNLKVEAIEQGELTEEMVDELVDAGWEIDSHTISHADVTTLDGEDLRREVADSRAELQRRFGEPVDFFCYPAGAYDAEAIAAVEEAGYLGATTVEPGLATPDKPYELNRIRIEPGDGPDELAAKLGA